MVDRYNAKAFARIQGSNLKSKLGSLYASTLESKIARSFSDDVDIRHGAGQGVCITYRPGQRDDEADCRFTRILPA